jgi:hypothetical protein
MKTNDNGMGELLEVLKTHPDLISALVFDPVSIKRLLKTKAARRLVLGVDTKAFLRYLAGPQDGGPIAHCLKRTAVLCPKKTRCPHGLGTKHPTPCGPHTKPPPACPKALGTKPPCLPGTKHPKASGGRAKG